MRDVRRLRPLDGAVIGIVLAAIVLLAVRAPGEGSAVPSGSTPSTVRPPVTSNRPFTPPTSTPVTSGAPDPATSPVAPLAALRIDDRQLATAPYARDLFPTWLDLDGNGCDTRDDVLVDESLLPATRSGCDVTGGSWLSLYDGVDVTDPGALEVDHLVPLANAWRSGAHAWDAERRARFANHLDERDHLVAVTVSSNRSKGDSAPDLWRPPLRSAWCRYATAWVTVKVAWDLTATTSERDALGEMLATC